MLLEVATWRRQRWLDGGGEVHGCGGDGDWVAPKENEGKHKVGNGKGNIIQSLGWMEVDRSDGKKMTGEREYERRWHLGDEERSGRVGVE